MLKNSPRLGSALRPLRDHFFTGLCQSLPAAGNLIPDVWFAALAIESDSEWITTDRDYEKFPGLRWRHPLPGNASVKPSP